MKQICIAICLFISSGLYAVGDARTWIYTALTPSSLGQAYSGVANPLAGDLWLNPSLPAVDSRFQVSLLSGSSTLNQVNLIELSLPVAIGKFSAGYASLHDSEPYDVSRFFIGFAREIISGVFFGFSGYGLNQIAAGQSDLAWGGDLGLFFRLPQTTKILSPLRMDHHAFGLSVHGIGKPSLLYFDKPVPALGVRAGWNFRWLHLSSLDAFSEIDGTFDALPFNAFGNLSVRFRIADLFSIYGGTIFGKGISNIDFWSAGASLAFKLGRSDLEIFYHLNPKHFNQKQEFLHSVGLEFSWGNVDRTPPKLVLRIHSDSDDTNYYFSPNYDGANDRIVFDTDAQDSSPIILWKLIIQDESGKIVKTIERKVNAPGLKADELWNLLWQAVPKVKIPKQIVWDATDNNGNQVQDGNYTAFCVAKDLLRNTGYSYTNHFTIDTQAPTAGLGLSDELFSPNGDGHKDSITIFQTLSTKDHWKAEIRDTSGKLIRSWKWFNQAPSELEWNGLDERGNKVKDGTYDYIVYGSDKAGNRTLMSIPGIQVNTSDYSVLLDVKPAAISPAQKQKLTLIPNIPRTNGLKDWKLMIHPKSGNAFILKQGKTPPLSFTWEGKNLPDGIYYFTLSANFANGAHPSITSRSILIDNAPPSFEFGWEPKRFTPDGNNQDDELEFHFIAVDRAGMDHWKIEILNTRGDLFQSFEGTGNPATNIYWSGRSKNGELVESARDYPVRISLFDVLGNAITNLLIGQITTGILQDHGLRGWKIALPPITFESTQSALGGSAYPILDRLSEILNRFPDARVELRGYSLMNEISPHQLSLARAEAVKAYLTGHGIAFDRLQTIDGGVIEENQSSVGLVEFILKQ